MNDGNSMLIICTHICTHTTSKVTVVRHIDREKVFVVVIVWNISLRCQDNPERIWQTVSTQTT